MGRIAWQAPGHSDDVCRELRKWTGVPILVLSAVTDESAKIDALDAGADDYVTKPFSGDELLARLRAALRRGSSPGELLTAAVRISVDGATIYTTLSPCFGRGR